MLRETLSQNKRIIHEPHKMQPGTFGSSVPWKNAEMISSLSATENGSRHAKGLEPGSTAGKQWGTGGEQST